MRLPTTRQCIPHVSVAVKVKWDIIHTVLLLLHCDESLSDKSDAVTFVLQNFVYFHINIFNLEVS